MKSDDDSESTASPNEIRVLSRKEFAKEQRREAYQKAKLRRATDPKYLAMKEQAKEQRRAAYQKIKAKRKEEEAALKVKKKAAEATEREEKELQTQQRQQKQRQGQRSVTDQELGKLLTLLGPLPGRGSTASN